MSDTTHRANTEPAFHDKVYRSGSAIAGGTLLLAVMLWLCIDALFRGAGRSPLFAGAVLVLGVPLIIAFTYWPQVRVNADRVLVRNPFRTIEAPWGAVESVVATLSVELRAGGRKFVIWALPVSLRQRKRAGRKAMIKTGDRATVGRFGAPVEADTGPTMAIADKAVAELNERLEARRAEGDASPETTPGVKVTWTWALIVPMAVGAIALAVLFATN